MNNRSRLFNLALVSIIVLSTLSLIYFTFDTSDSIYIINDNKKRPESDIINNTWNDGNNLKSDIKFRKNKRIYPFRKGGQYELKQGIVYNTINFNQNKLVQNNISCTNISNNTISIEKSDINNIKNDYSINKLNSIIISRHITDNIDYNNTDIQIIMTGKINRIDEISNPDPPVAPIGTGMYIYIFFAILWSLIKYNK